jgi:hypothetical protein
VIIAFSTKCENTGAGWDANYEEMVVIQDWYIKYMHRLWGALNIQFSDYNARVSLSAEAINIDRDTDYPKVAGVHTNAVHPAASGYVKLGENLAYYINAIETII